MSKFLFIKCKVFISICYWEEMDAALLLSSRELNAVHIPAVFFVWDTKQYSQTCIKRHRIKRSPSVKRSVFKVPENYFSWCTVISTSIKRSPLLSGRGHHLRSPNATFLIVLTCIKRSHSVHTVSNNVLNTCGTTIIDFLVYFHKSFQRQKWMFLFEVKHLFWSALEM